MRSTIRLTTALLVVAGISLAADTTYGEATDVASDQVMNADQVLNAANPCDDPDACIYVPDLNICFCPDG
ncbi:MAG: hypothetical protein ACODAE_09655 [Gemmatimonadota bacterium]